jgi:hypothetical protein
MQMLQQSHAATLHMSEQEAASSMRWQLWSCAFVQQLLLRTLVKYMTQQLFESRLATA